VSAEDVRAIAEEALSEHDGWYRFRDRRRRTDEIHALARAYLEAEARLARLERIAEQFISVTDPLDMWLIVDGNYMRPATRQESEFLAALAATEEGAEE